MDYSTSFNKGPKFTKCTKTIDKKNPHYSYIKLLPHNVSFLLFINCKCKLTINRTDTIDMQRPTGLANEQKCINNFSIHIIKFVQSYQLII